MLYKRNINEYLSFKSLWGNNFIHSRFYKLSYKLSDPSYRLLWLFKRQTFKLTMSEYKFRHSDCLKWLLFSFGGPTSGEYVTTENCKIVILTMLKNPSGITKIVSQIKISILSKLDTEMCYVVASAIFGKCLPNKRDGHIIVFNTRSKKKNKSNLKNYLCLIDKFVKVTRY